MVAAKVHAMVALVWLLLPLLVLVVVLVLVLLVLVLLLLLLLLSVLLPQAEPALDQFLQSVANDRRDVIAASVNEGYISFAMNWLCSISDMGIKVGRV